MVDKFGILVDLGALAGGFALGLGRFTAIARARARARGRGVAK